MQSPVDPSLRLSAQRALLRAICPSIRLIKVRLANGEIDFSVVSAGPLSDAEHDVLSTAAAEIVSDFPTCTIKESYTVHNHPLPREDVLVHGWVYARAEPA